MKCFLKKPLACLFTLETSFIFNFSFYNYLKTTHKDTEKPVKLDVGHAQPAHALKNMLCLERRPVPPKGRPWPRYTDNRMQYAKTMQKTNRQWIYGDTQSWPAATKNCKKTVKKYLKANVCQQNPVLRHNTKVLLQMHCVLKQNI